MCVCLSVWPLPLQFSMNRAFVSIWIKSSFNRIQIWTFPATVRKTFAWCVTSVLWVCYKCAMSVLQVFYECVTSVLWVCYKCDTIVLYWCCDWNTSVLWVSYKCAMSVRVLFFVSFSASLLLFANVKRFSVSCRHFGFCH